MKNPYERIIKRIITEATHDDKYSYKNVKQVISPIIKQMRAEIQKVNQKMDIIYSMAARIQKGILQRDSLEDIKNEWHHANRISTTIFELKLAMSKKLKKQFGDKSPIAVDREIATLHRPAAKLASICHRSYVRCESESIENIFDNVENARDAISTLNDKLYKITEGILY